jgi:NDP-sugar pyrophosphorylase family protein
MGVSAFGEAELSDLPARGCLVQDYLLPRLRRGARVATLVESSPFTDVGSLPEYLAANLSWLEERAGSGESWAHENARVARAVTLKESVVGEGAVVGGEGTLEHCVVWPGAHARAPLARAVVTTGGRVVPVSDVLAAEAGR